MWFAVDETWNLAIDLGRHDERDPLPARDERTHRVIDDRFDVVKPVSPRLRVPPCTRELKARGERGTGEKRKKVAAFAG